MMLKKISMAAAALALSFAMTSQASQTIVIGDFDDGTAQGWFAAGSRAVSVVPDTFTGSGFLMSIDKSGLNGFDWSLGLDDPANAALFLLNNVGGPQIVEFDIYWDPPSDWDGDGWMQWTQIAYNYDGGWTQVQPTVPADRDYNTLLGPGTNHLVHDFIGGGAPLSGAPTGYAELRISTNVGDNDALNPATVGTWYLDNITITVPEPGTLALLGLGGLLMVARRRVR